MQMNEQVLTALEVLRNFAENDFERHRIDVLEKDLTAPPKVEVIDDTHQKFDGVIYSKKKTCHYENTLSIHRAVFYYYHGEIPNGNYEIHHKDLNPANNDISNLQLLTISQHRKIHRKLTPYTERICKNCGKTFLSRNTAPVMFCKECRLAKNYENRQCIICGKKFLTRKYDDTKCCSVECSRILSANTQAQNSIPNPEMQKICPICGKFFIAKKSKQTCCSLDCGYKLAAQKNTKPKIEKICPVCGKTFIFNRRHPKTQCCSRECGRKFAHKIRKANKK